MNDKTEKIIELIEKYYSFTLAFIILSISLFVFRNNERLVMMIVGGVMGLISAPVLLPKNKI